MGVAKDFDVLAKGVPNVCLFKGVFAKKAANVTAIDGIRIDLKFSACLDWLLLTFGQFRGLNRLSFENGVAFDFEGEWHESCLFLCGVDDYCFPRIPDFSDKQLHDFAEEEIEKCR